MIEIVVPVVSLTAVPEGEFVAAGEEKPVVDIDRETKP